MANIFDLQIQSSASDGKHAPAEILAMAGGVGLAVIALTDHDTVAGVPEALDAGTEQGIRVIPGIELSVEERGAHILGFGLDYRNPELLGRLEEFRRSRIKGARQMVENLQRAGFSVEWSDVEREATGAVVARPHIARSILGRGENKEKLGGVSTTHDFIEIFLSDESPYYVRRAHPRARDAITLIHNAAGVAVWSHPAIHFHPVRSNPPEADAVQPETSRPIRDFSNGGTTSNGVQDNYEGLERFLKQLIEWGIDGIEIFNPSHTEDDVEFLHGLAQKYMILRTGGSDFHEKGEHAADERGLHSARFIGDYDTYGFPIDDIMPRLNKAMESRRGEGRE